MDGAMIASLAKRLEIALNQNSWSGFSNAYTALETELCDRSYQNIIESFLRNNLNHLKIGDSKLSMSSPKNVLWERKERKSQINWMKL